MMLQTTGLVSDVTGNKVDKREGSTEGEVKKQKQKGTNEQTNINENK